MWKILLYIVVAKFTSALYLEEIRKNDLTFQVAYGNMYGVVNQSVPILQENYFKNLPNVKTLLLSNDQIETILPGTFHQLPDLKVLHLSQNKLSSIKEGIFTGLQLTTLNLDDNGIEFISSAAFDNMTQLIGISITQNPLNYWDSRWFTNTPFLIIIKMDYNQIKELGDEAFGNFQGDRNLAVNFNYNKIQRIDDGAFKNVKILTRLSLNNNRLQVLNGNFLNGVRIQSLDISRNQIRCVDDEDFEKIFVASVTYVSGNPWDCDCFRKIKEWTRINGLKLKSGRKRCGHA